MPSPKFLLLAFGVGPAFMLTTTTNSMTLTYALVIYSLNWATYCIAIRRHHSDEILDTFLHSRVGKIAIFAFLMVIQSVAIAINANLASIVSLTLALPALLLWATAASADLYKLRMARFMTVAFSLLLFSVIGEFGARLLMIRQPANDYRSTTWGHTVTLNSLGFREREFNARKLPGTFRVMVLGDSLTWGVGLPSEQRFTDRVEQLLKPHFPENKVEVLNFGVCGAPSIQQRDVLARHFHQVDPDLIVVGFCINDPQPHSQEYSLERKRFEPLFSLIDCLRNLGFNRTSGFVRDRLDHAFQLARLYPNWNIALDRAYTLESSEWKQFTRALKDIKDRSDALELRRPLFVPLLQGDGDFTKPDISLNYILKWCRQAARAAGDAGFDVIDMTDEFKSQGYQVRSVNRWDGHPSAACNEVYARHIARAILAQNADTP